MSRFTPGPWRVDANLGLGAYSVYSGDTHVCRTFTTSNLATITRETRDANAALIADAPALLEALRNLHDFSDVMLKYETESKAAFTEAVRLLEKHGA